MKIVLNGVFGVTAVIAALSSCLAPTSINTVEFAEDVSADSLDSGTVAPIGNVGDVVEDIAIARHVTWTDDDGETQEYDLLVGPDTSAFVKPNGVVVVNGGWVFISGHWPYARTRRVSGGAMGSEMIVQVEATDGGDVERYYFTHGIRAFVYPADPNDPLSQRFEWTDFDRYREIGSIGGLVEKRLSENPTQSHFVNRVIRRASQAGIREESAIVEP